MLSLIGSHDGLPLKSGATIHQGARIGIGGDGCTHDLGAGIGVFHADVYRRLCNQFPAKEHVAHRAKGTVEGCRPAVCSFRVGLNWINTDEETVHRHIFKLD